ncbi:hypothetical protein EJF18_40668 [Clavispora lusitaniae]|uniref:Uncharacterized protein n=1 Tax=Clavispora lusitaniae TaxID=36911 RepID=A0ACD0WM73_CLALS|nr:hypothetical protein EJF14_40668 [Clavispora lusitaniae]QFZ34287.1 hypothetical protein EJF16_40668 [Clavispora lusitaniae]QFZ39971.1 hypothetical protein EJF15_40668 [Clavispora lusitaniae]QFZ45653.1 hypothetical protein EJF18_40668 [Clavispora lusitaniae]QFZ51317.1 hypothetical protein EJF17_40668 [Clavispora lusitaniae]
MIFSLLLFSIVLIAISSLYFDFRGNTKITKSSSIANTKGNPLSNIKPVSPMFDWKKQVPLKSYPFKDKKYKLTMAIRNLDAQSWLLLESTYLDRIEEKTKLSTNNHPAYPKEKDLERSTVFSSQDSDPAIREFYDIVTKYMCDKYPMYFVVQRGDTVYNSITHEYIPRNAKNVPIRKLLHYLIRTIEEDFIIMMPDNNNLKEGNCSEYFFKGGVFAFANGFDPANKFNKPLTAIHEPVPGYEEKLKVSMNKFFSRIQPGEFVSRSNFSVQTHPKLYVDDSNKGYHFESQQTEPLEFDNLDFTTDMYYRSERQVLTRLPKTNAVVFTIRTYLHPFTQFHEVDAEVPKRFKGALDGIPEDIASYKNQSYWGPAARRFLQEL